MDANEYQFLTDQTAIYSEGANEFVSRIFGANDLTSNSILNAREFMGLLYCAMKLNGEAGEIGEIVGKCLRDKSGRLDNDVKNRLYDELGDVLWYVAQICQILKFGMNSIMEDNIQKLMDRKDRGVLSGSGNDR